LGEKEQLGQGGGGLRRFERLPEFTRLMLGGIKHSCFSLAKKLGLHYFLMFWSPYTTKSRHCKRNYKVGVGGRPKLYR